MLKAKCFLAYALPYSLLISRIYEYKGVNTIGKQVQMISDANEIFDGSLKQMKFVLFRDQCIHIDEVPQYDNDDEVPAPALVHAVHVHVGSSSGVVGSSSLEENISNMNKRIEELLILSGARHEEVVGLFRV